MILNIVTATPNDVLKDLKFFLPSDFDISYIEEVTKGIHEYSVIPKHDDCILSIANFLELGYSAWDIRIR